jgi:glycosyltransferase involved in cell wall biosynthesis
LVYVIEGLAYQIIKRARQGGAVGVLQGSIHARHTASILAPEYRSLGLPFNSQTLGISRLEREYAEADFVVVQSSFAASTYIQAGVPAQKLVAIPLGVDLSIFSPASTERGPSPTRTFQVLYVGQISVRKGVARLVEAIASTSDVEIELILIGKMDTEFASIWDRVQRVGGNRLRWIPGVARHELPIHYRHADLVVLPSLLDSFGATALEAMACGTAVLVTDACGVPVRNDVDGIVVPARDTRAIAQAISTLASDRSRVARYGENGRQRATQFPWSRFQAAILDFIYSAVETRRQSRLRQPES